MNYHTSPAFSFSGEKNYNFTIPNSSPGPKYLHTTDFSKLKTTKIGASKRSVMGLSETPPPGKYQHKIFTTEHAKVTIPKTHKQSKQTNFNPGPGSYNASHDQVQQRASSYALGYKFKSYFDDQSGRPGPGHYDPKLKNPIQQKLSKIGKSDRPSLARDPSIPGVGDYQIGKTTLILNKQSIGNSERPKIKDKNPGAGSYEIKSSLQQQIEKRKGISLSSRLIQKPYQTYLQSPGPNYDVTSMNDKAYSIGKQKRQNKQFHSNNQVPGPFDYNYKMQQILKKSNSGTIPKAKLKQTYILINTPGPGSYKIQSKLKDSYTISRSKSVNFNSIHKNPSPAEYNIFDANSKKKQIKIGTSQRYNFVNKNKTGPGDYNIGGNIAKSGGKTIPKQPRKEDRNSNPGPGHYSIPTTISNLNKYSLYKSQS